MARLTGGPVIVFISGRLATIRGLVGSRMSMIDTVSLPAAWRTVLPFSSNDTFSSLPVIKSCARVPPTGASSVLAAALSASSRKKAFMVSSRFVTLLAQVCHARDPGATPVGWGPLGTASAQLVAIVEKRRERYRHLTLLGRALTLAA